MQTMLPVKTVLTCAKIKLYKTCWNCHNQSTSKVLMQIKLPQQLHFLSSLQWNNLMTMSRSHMPSIFNCNRRNGRLIVSWEISKQQNVYTWFPCIVQVISSSSACCSQEPVCPDSGLHFKSSPMQQFYLVNT